MFWLTHIREFARNCRRFRTTGRSLRGSRFVVEQLEARVLLTVNDPLFADQWHLENMGQAGGRSGEDLNVVPAWTQATGAGVVVGIVDGGVEHTHPDLAANYLASASFDFADNDNDPAPEPAEDAHGTASAGIVAAQQSNNVGVSGVAPDANVAGLRIFDENSSLTTNFSPALTYMNQVIDIYSNSWGFTNPYVADSAVVTAMADGVTNGRNAQGSVFVWSGGNGLGTRFNSNAASQTSTRFGVVVAAVDDQGQQASYSNPGASILVSAYAGDAERDKAEIVTTDRAGAAGYNSFDAGDDSWDYTTTANGFSGTSAAAPQVSGVIALMLEANPNLTYRDVQHILAQTARQNFAADWDWSTNGAGLPINHKHGFGVVDTAAAVTAAQSWTNVSDEVSVLSPQIPINTAIPDSDGTGLTSTITVTDDIDVEWVEVILNVQHSRRGDLELTLVSPDGTESILGEPGFDDGTDLVSWSFTSSRHWGESSLGDWTLRVADRGLANRVTVLPAAAAPVDTRAGAAVFGPPVPLDGFTQNVVAAEPVDACTDLTNAAAVAGSIVLIDRGTCFFTEKVKAAQDAGAIGVVIANNVADTNLLNMAGHDPTLNIPAVFVTQNDGDLIRSEIANGAVELTLAGTHVPVIVGDPVNTGTWTSWQMNLYGTEPPADLLATAFNVVNDHAVTGVANVDFTVHNSGAIDSGSFQTHLVWSKNAVLGDADDIVVAASQENFNSLAANTSVSRTASVQLDRDALYAHTQASDTSGLAVGTESTDVSYLFLKVDVNDDVAESDESNNSALGKLIDSDDLTYFPWDTDGDGVISPSDAVRAIHAIGSNDSVHDFDGNGVVTPLEVLSSLQRIGYTRNDGVVGDAPGSASTNSDQIAGASLAAEVAAVAAAPSAVAEPLWVVDTNKKDADDLFAVEETIEEDRLVSRLDDVLPHIDHKFSTVSDWLDIV